METRTIQVHERNFDVHLFEENGKVYAKTHLPLIGEIKVADFGKGKEGAVRQIAARIGNFLKVQEEEEERKAKREQQEQESSAAEN